MDGEEEDSPPRPSLALTMIIIFIFVTVSLASTRPEGHCPFLHMSRPIQIHTRRTYPHHIPLTHA